ncbi:hypothetical protein [Pseudomonas fontis]|uniref:DUF3077 domain-containing protein n=1 Tax=Pseudomonas fontis TaxID=2942633 RepID=A0ABT5NND5_9PSED|nr:hypothetical protein [Pseudomonas fontis]MDD0973206.1 hypothetical protein [Pseudomonas fontis]MDD0989662.1 hypothetical protein [Pseudomonas fontis]
MKKLVPDPPPLHDCYTTPKSIGHCNEHDNLFCVAPGIHAEDALVHIALLLDCAFTTCTQAIEFGEGSARSFSQCTQQSVELAKGLVSSLIEGVGRYAPASPHSQ